MWRDKKIWVFIKLLIYIHIQTTLSIQKKKMSPLGFRGDWGLKDKRMVSGRANDTKQQAEHYLKTTQDSPDMQE